MFQEYTKNRKAFTPCGFDQQWLLVNVSIDCSLASWYSTVIYNIETILSSYSRNGNTHNDNQRNSGQSCKETDNQR